ncbi:tetratricopeptide repeat protein, partial [Candidatus Poribacteria bacterium]|nr:tetratricopeptide repeat protein [Candidatus Poribacteria bacterium]
KETLLWSLYEIAKTYRHIGERERALALLEQMLVLIDEGEYSYKLRAEIFRQFGTLHFYSGQWSDAQVYYQKSLALFEANNDVGCTASIHNSLGYIAVQQGDYDLAKTHHQQVFEVSQGKNDCKRLAAAAHNSLGIIASIQADWDAALDNFEESIAIYEELDVPREAAGVFVNLAMAYVDVGELEAAGSCYAQATELVEKSGDLLKLSEIYVNRAEFHLQVSNIDAAELYANKALAIFDKIDDAIGIAEVYKLYGCIHRHQKKWAAAIEAFNQSISGYQSSQNPQGEAEGCYEFGRMHLDAENLSQARYFLNRSRVLYQSLDATHEIQRVDAQLKIIAA